MWGRALGWVTFFSVSFAACGGGSGGDGPPTMVFTGGSSGLGGGGADGSSTGGASGGSGASGGTSGTGASGGTAGTGASGGTGGTGGTTTGVGCAAYATMTADAACTKWGTALCKLWYQCSTDYGVTQGYDTQTTCQARLKLECLQSLAAPGVQLKPAAYSVAADIWGKTACTTLYAFQNPVGDAIEKDPACGTKGSRADGAGCYLDEQCTGNICDVPSGAHCGTCKSPGKQGAPCGIDVHCAVGFYCVSKLCQPEAQLGQTCSVNPQCVSGAFCSSGKCAPRLAAGGTCDDDSDCQVGLVCGSTDTCKTPSLAVAGASCDPLETLSCNSWKSYDCDPTTKKCVLETYPGPGQPCGSTTGDFGCTGGATCVMPTGQWDGTCMKVLADGASCSESSGADCLDPAECVNSKCTVVDATVCP